MATAYRMARKGSKSDDFAVDFGGVKIVFVPKSAVKGTHDVPLEEDGEALRLPPPPE